MRVWRESTRPPFSARRGMQMMRARLRQRPRTDLKEIFDRYGSLRDVYIPVDFYTK